MSGDFTPLELLADRLRKAPSADREIFAIVINGCSRIAALRKAGKASHLDRLFANGAWTDAALTLLAMELPAWTVRRLIYEDGEWICSLSQQPNLPLAVDDTVDTQHPDLPVAILAALTEARARTASRHDRQSVPRIKSEPGYVHCCDNFA